MAGPFEIGGQWLGGVFGGGVGALGGGTAGAVEGAPEGALVGTAIEPGFGTLAGAAVTGGAGALAEGAAGEAVGQRIGAAAGGGLGAWIDGKLGWGDQTLCGGNCVAMSKQSKKSGKEKANDTPSWAAGEKPRDGESGKDFAGRLLDQKYGPGNYNTGPGSEYNQLKKYGDRSR